MTSKKSQKSLKLQDLIRELCAEHGSRNKLLKAMISMDPMLAGMKADQITKWIQGVSRPNYQQALALALLMQAQSEDFWKSYEEPDDDRVAKDTPKRSAKQPSRVSVYGVSWIGSRTTELDAMCQFYEEVLGLHEVHRCQEDHAIFRTDNGDSIALYGPSGVRYSLFNTGPVVGFRVTNIIAARSEMEKRGVKFIGPIHSRENGRWKYSHYKAPDGNIYEIVEEKPWADIE